MSRPPTDDNDPHRWQDLLDQVDDALLDSSLDDPETRAAILAGVRDAMNTLLPPEEEAAAPTRPHFRIIHSDADEDDDSGEYDAEDEDEDDDSDYAPRPTTSVRIHTLRRLPTLSGEEGVLHLPAGGTQLVLRASQPWLYRLMTESGALTVVLDGEEIGVLEAGQTLDVEGRSIQVRAAGATQGRYRRL